MIEVGKIYFIRKGNFMMEDKNFWYSSWEGGDLFSANIIICSNNHILCRQLSKHLKDYESSYKKKISIHIRHACQEVLPILEKSSCNLLFLDVSSEYVNSIEYGQFIRQNMENHSLEIIYISEKPFNFSELFDSKPFAILTVPIAKELLFLELNKFFRLLIQKRALFIYKKKRCTIQENLENILYFESNLKKIYIYTLSGNDYFYGSLKEVYNCLQQEYFFFCHNSILVNYKNIRKIYYDKICLCNYAVLPISQSKRPEVKRLVCQWQKV